MSHVRSRLDEVAKSDLERIIATDESLHEEMIRLFRRKAGTFLVATSAR